MSPTGISWTDETWNPTVGCSKAGGPGCDNCYAMHQAARGLRPEHKGLTVRDGSELDWTGELRLLPERLDLPLRWAKPRRVFVDSMSDLFHPKVPDEYVAEVWARMALAGQHLFQVLTKRPERAARVLGSDRFRSMFSRVVYRVGQRPELRRHLTHSTGAAWPPPNVGLGASAETQEWADRRVPPILAAHAAGDVAWTFLSLEPLLGPITLAEWLADLDGGERHVGLGQVGWVIVGGESQRGARPMHLGWARALRDECQAAGVPFHLKQLGSWVECEAGDPRGTAVVGPDGWRWYAATPPTEDEVVMRHVGVKVAGRELDGRVWDEAHQ